MAAGSIIYDRVCMNCNNAYKTKRGISRFCSKKCNCKYLYDRRDIAADNLKRKNRASQPGSAAKKRHEFRYNNDINYKMTCVLRARFCGAIRSNHKTGSAVSDLGCSIDECKIYIESLWLPGMSWENWARDGWHIDHIIPLISFNLEDPEQVKKACHYTNLQPLWARDNILKRDKICHS